MALLVYVSFQRNKKWNHFSLIPDYTSLIYGTGYCYYDDSG